MAIDSAATRSDKRQTKKRAVDFAFSWNLLPKFSLAKETISTSRITRYHPVPICSIENESLNCHPLLQRKGYDEKIVETVRNAPLENKEIVIVDDGSQDGTQSVLKERISEMVNQIVYHPVNRGKGAALRSGFAAASGDIILVQDADLEYDPADYPAILGSLMSGKADAVFGSRFMGGRPHRILFFWHMAGNRLLTLLSNMFTNLNLTDMETGYYKAFKASLIKSIKIEEDRFGVEPEIIAKLARRKCRIYEVGIFSTAAFILKARRSIGRMA